MTSSGRRSGALVLLAALTVGAALLRIALAARIPITDDEAYYWLWSRHLAWGYPDHPPMIAALIAIATSFAGDGAFAIRTVTVLLASVTPLLVYAAGRDLFDAVTGVRAAVIASVLPIAALGTALAFPDGPLASLWMLGLWTGWRAVRDGGRWWIAAGVAAGLAVLTKVIAVFVIVGMAGTLTAGGGWRRALRDPALYVGAALAALIVAPFILWNATHDWWTVRFALTLPLWIRPRSVPENLLLFGAAQLGYHGVAAVALVAAVIAAVRRPALPWRLLAWMSAPVFLAVLASAAWAKAKPHWASPAYLVAAIALSALWPAWRGWRIRLSAASIALTALLTMVAAAAALLPLGLDLTASFGRWDAVAKVAARRAEERRNAGRPAFILTDGYQAASQIAYHLRERLVVHPLRAAFLFWSPPERLFGWDLVYVENDGTWKSRIRQQCAAVTQAETLTVSRMQTVTLYLCEEFSGVPPP